MIRLLIVISVIAWFAMLHRVVCRYMFPNNTTEPFDSKTEATLFSWFLTIPITLLCLLAGLIIFSTLIWVYNGF